MKNQPLKLRPSSASRWIACPASARLSTLVPYQESGEAAKIGTAIHALAETCFQLDTDPMKFVGQVVEGITMTEENCSFALEHLQAIWAIQDELGHVKVEQLFKLYQEPAFSLQGTADVVGISQDKLIIADLKTGRGYVDADSEQMKIYALGALLHNSQKPKEVEFQIIQPHHGEKRIHRMSVDELGVWETEVLLPAIAYAISDDPPYNPSESACQWCPAKHICSAQKEQFDIVAAQPNITLMSKEEIKEVMVTLTPAQISAILDRAPMVEKFIEAVKDHATKQMEAGAVLPGWQLQPKRASRKWIDSTTARQALTDAGLTDSQIFETELISPTAAEKLLPKEQRVILDALTAKVSSGLTLAKDRSLSQ
jgi:CRISPR/Cas system-associated exonuclease Cas4 (RecB family)